MTTKEMLAIYERRSRKLDIRILCAENEELRDKYKKEKRACDGFVAALRAMNGGIETAEGVRMEVR